MDLLIYYFVICSAGYLIGSIPFGLLIGKLAGLGDIRNVGSGNIGATNMMRAGGKGLAALTLFLDAGKGYAAVFLASAAQDSTAFIAALAGLFAVIGHMYPVWLKFKGGKGIATTIGVLFALNPLIGMSFVTLWIIVFATTRISSVAGLVATLLMPAFGYLFLEDAKATVVLLMLAALIFWRHRDNLKRLLRGEEKRIG